MEIFRTRLGETVADLNAVARAQRLRFQERLSVEQKRLPRFLQAIATGTAGKRVDRMTKA